MMLECSNFILHQLLLSVLSSDFKPPLDTLERDAALCIIEILNLGDTCNIRLINEIEVSRAFR